MTIDLKTPTRWQDLTAEQLRFVVATGTQGLRREEFLVVLFCHFAEVKMLAGTAKENDKMVVCTRFKDKDGHVFELEEWQVSDFCGRLSAFFDEQIPIDVAWPFRWDRYLLDTTFGNWFHADALMLRFAMEGNPEYLKSALKDFGEEREPDNTDMVLLIRWYEAFKDWLQNRYPLVFQKAEPGMASPSSPIETRQNILLMLNENRPQDNEQIERSNMHDVLAALQHKIEQANQAAEYLQQIKPQ